MFAELKAIQDTKHILRTYVPVTGDILCSMQQPQYTAGPTEYDASTVARDMVDVAVDKKASDVTLIEVGRATTLADYFVIATGTSERQINAIRSGIQERMKDDGIPLLGHEGVPADGWILLDYGQVIAHIFASDQREYYDLERRWNEAPTLLKIQ
jgi:ribosome-associated protein